MAMAQRFNLQESIVLHVCICRRLKSNIAANRIQKEYFDFLPILLKFTLKKF